MKLLCRDAAYGPYILSGTENRRRRESTRTIESFPAYQVVWVTDGAVRYRLDGKTRTPEAPFVLLLQPGRDFRVTLPASVTWNFLRFDVIFQPRRPYRHKEPLGHNVCSFVRTGSEPQPDARMVWGSDLPVEVPRDLTHRSMAKLQWCNAHWWRSATNYARANAHLGLWLVDLVDAVNTHRRSNVNWLERLRLYCLDNMVHGTSVAELTAVAGLSRQHLRLKLLKACGMNPKEFIDSLRMDEACRYLTTTRYRIERISRLCGYSSPPIFSRRFRKQTGLSPRQWRQRQNLDPS